jgi:hypothetical protein
MAKRFDDPPEWDDRMERLLRRAERGYRHSARLAAGMRAAYRESGLRSREYREAAGRLKDCTRRLCEVHDAILAFYRAMERGASAGEPPAFGD